MIPELLIGTGIATLIVVSGLSIDSFIRNAKDENDEPGCTAHHFEVDKEYEKYKVEKYLRNDDGEKKFSWVVKQRLLKKCQHEGCSKRKKTYTDWQRFEDIHEWLDSEEENEGDK